MDAKENYIDILLISLKKKISILEKLDIVVMDQERILRESQVSLEELDENDKQKGSLLQELEDADEGFEKIYNRVKEEFSKNIGVMKPRIVRIFSK